MLDSFYHNYDIKITVQSLKPHFGVKMLRYCHIYVKRVKASFHNFTRKCIQNFHLGRYIVGYTVTATRKRSRKM